MSQRQRQLIRAMGIEEMQRENTQNGWWNSKIVWNSQTGRKCEENVKCMSAKRM